MKCLVENTGYWVKIKNKDYEDISEWNTQRQHYEADQIVTYQGKCYRGCGMKIIAQPGDLQAHVLYQLFKSPMTTFLIIQGILCGLMMFQLYFLTTTYDIEVQGGLLVLHFLLYLRATMHFNIVKNYES